MHYPAELPRKLNLQLFSEFVPVDGCFGDVESLFASIKVWPGPLAAELPEPALQAAADPLHRLLLQPPARTALQGVLLSQGPPLYYPGGSRKGTDTNIIGCEMCTRY